MKVKIIKTPTGQAPEWVRNAWVGIEFEAVRDIPIEGFDYIGVLGGKASSENIGGYKTRAQNIVNRLRETNPEAADWWEENVPLFGDLVFGTKFCEVISV